MANDARYENGVSHGAIYLADGSVYLWPGLTSLRESSSSSLSETYYDGSLINLEQQPYEYSAEVTSYTYPEILDEPGTAFNFTYQTQLNVNGVDHPQIHLIYNAVAFQQQSPNATDEELISLVDFTWGVFATPEHVGGYDYTSHFIVDSSELSELEFSMIKDLLYGSDTADPIFPTPEEILEFLRLFMVTITDHGDGTWSAEGADHLIAPAGEDMYSIESNAITFINSTTYTIETGDE